MTINLLKNISNIKQLLKFVSASMEPKQILNNILTNKERHNGKSTRSVCRQCRECDSSP